MQANCAYCNKLFSQEDLKGVDFCVSLSEFPKFYAYYTFLCKICSKTLGIRWNKRCAFAVTSEPGQLGVRSHIVFPKEFYENVSQNGRPMSPRSAQGPLVCCDKCTTLVLKRDAVTKELEVQLENNEKRSFGARMCSSCVEECSNVKEEDDSQFPKEFFDRVRVFGTIY